MNNGKLKSSTVVCAAPLSQTPVAPSNPPSSPQWSPLGIILCFSASLLFSIATLNVKFALPQFSFLLIVLFRSIFQTIAGIITFYFVHCKYNVPLDFMGPAESRHLVFARGFWGAVSLALLFFTISQLPLGDANAIFFVSPILTAIVARIWLKEPWALLNSIAAAISLIGVAFIARPTFLFPNDHGAQDQQKMAEEHSNDADVLLPRSWATLLALFGAFCTAMAFVTIRRAGRSVHFLSHVVTFGAVSSMIGIGILPYFYSYSEAIDQFRNAPLSAWLHQLACAICAFLAQCCLNSGLQREKAGVAAFLKAFDVIFAFIFQITLLDQVPDGLSISGAILVIFATFVIVMQTVYTNRYGGTESRGQEGSGEVKKSGRVVGRKFGEDGSVVFVPIPQSDGESVSEADVGGEKRFLLDEVSTGDVFDDGIVSLDFDGVEKSSLSTVYY